MHPRSPLFISHIHVYLAILESNILSHLWPYMARMSCNIQRCVCVGLSARPRALVTRWWPCSADPDISVNSGRKARQVHCPSNNEIRSLSSSNYPHCAVRHKNQIKGIIKATYSNVLIGSRDKQPFTGVRERVLIGASDVDRRFHQFHPHHLPIFRYRLQGRSCFKNGREIVCKLYNDFKNRLSF